MTAGRVVCVLIILIVPPPVLPFGKRDLYTDDEAQFPEGEVPDDGVSCGRLDSFRFSPSW